MKWFKHWTDCHMDSDICDAMREFGPLGYAFFIMLLEIYGAKYNESDESGFLRVSTATMCYKMHIKAKTLPKLFAFFSERKRLEYWYVKEFVEFKVSEFIKLASKWEKRKLEKI